LRPERTFLSKIAITIRSAVYAVFDRFFAMKGSIMTTGTIQSGTMSACNLQAS
jgi:hypothetical protein